MKASVEPLEGNKVKLSVEVDEVEVEKAVDAAFRKIAREVRIPGFRPGKAPRRLLEARLGTQVARDEALRDALPGYYSQAVRDNDVDVIAAPEIEITAGEETGPIAFDAVVEVRPRITVPGYANLRVTIDRPDASEDEIDAQITRLREQDAELRAVDRPAATGDNVSLNISGTRGGEAAPGLTADDYLYEVGSGTVVPELDAQLLGAKIGDVLVFTSQVPGTEGTTEPVDFRVLIKDVKEKVLPDVDDEWANEVSEFETVEALRADIRNRITTVRKIQAQAALREKVVEALVELVDDEPPESLVQAEIQQRLQDLALRLSAQGLNAEQWLQMTGKSQEDLLNELRGLAGKAVMADLALRSIIEAETIDATGDDIENELASVAERAGQPVERVRREFERSEQMPAVRSDIKKRKALDWLLDHVEIVDPDGQPVDRADLQPATEEATERDEAEQEIAPDANQEVAEDEER